MKCNYLSVPEIAVNGAGVLMYIHIYIYIYIYIYKIYSGSSSENKGLYTILSLNLLSFISFVRYRMDRKWTQNFQCGKWYIYIYVYTWPTVTYICLSSMTGAGVGWGWGGGGEGGLNWYHICFAMSLQPIWRPCTDRFQVSMMVVTSGNAPVSISYELKLTREYMN